MKFIPLLSGSSGNSSLIVVGGKKLLVDAGHTGKCITDALRMVGTDPAELSGILVTHDHIDHTKGVGILSRRYNLPVYANAGTFEAMQPIVKEIAFSNVRLFRSGQDFYIGDINITPFRTPHDAAEPVGFAFTYRGCKLTYMTDIGCMREELYEYAANSRLLFIEANHDIPMLKNGPYPYPLKKRILSDKGHLSNENCGRALIRLYELGVRSAILGHLSKENNTEALAYSTVRGLLEASGIADMQLTVAKRDAVTGVFEF
ncbi:MAG: MBL fold metallo-hydrolase [Christensenellaceae bacterium]|nr:MBL fold metallo-hydrolase [Christensenellaceae bacterium]